MKRRTVAVSSTASRKGWRTRKQMKRARLPLSLTQRLQILRIINLKDTLPNPFLEINNET